MERKISASYTDQLTPNTTKFGLGILGFFLGPIGILVAGFIGTKRKYLEYIMEAVGAAIVGRGIAFVLEFILVNSGVYVPFWSNFNANHFSWHVLIFIIAILHIILWSMWLYGLKWKMTPEEKAHVMHGDDWIKPNEKHLRYDGGITLNCTPEKVWPYIRQAGQKKAGWYSYTWLEQLFTFDIHNTYIIRPEWQDMRVGDYQWFHQAPFSIGEWITEVDHGKHYFAAHSDSRVDQEGPNQEKAMNLPIFKYFCWTWNWEVYPINDKRCRLVWRCDCTFAPYIRPLKWMLVFTLGTASIFMGRHCMDVIAKLVNDK